MDVAIPEPFQYTNTRTSGPGVDIAADAGFLVSCACQDNCSSGGACPCQQLTLQEAKAIGDAKHPVGYLHHRLCRPQLSGYVPSQSLFPPLPLYLMSECFVVGSTSAMLAAAVVRSAPTEWCSRASGTDCRSTAPPTRGGACGRLTTFHEERLCALTLATSTQSRAGTK